MQCDSFDWSLIAVSTPSSSTAASTCDCKCSSDAINLSLSRDDRRRLSQASSSDGLTRFGGEILLALNVRVALIMPLARLVSPAADGCAGWAPPVSSPTYSIVAFESVGRLRF